MTDANLRDQAIHQLTQTTITYAAWVKRGRPQPEPPKVPLIEVVLVHRDDVPAGGGTDG